MKINIGYIDRIIRACLGLILLVVGYDLNSEWGVVGFYPLVTAYLGYCPFYHWLHINTFHPQ